LRRLSLALTLAGVLTLIIGGIAIERSAPSEARSAAADDHEHAAMAADRALLAELLPPPAGATPVPGSAATNSVSTLAAFTNPLFIPPVLIGAAIDMSIQPACLQILPGPCTNMWTYGGSYPGPTIRRPTGQTTEITFTNNLPAAAGPMSVHNHGNHSSPENDGQPHDFLIQPGELREYDYAHMEDGQPERGSTQFYHDHVMDLTGRNVWNGLMGFYILDDPADPQTLPVGQFDIPLLVADRQFDASNQIPYNFNRNGVAGTTILVNGTYQPFLTVGDRKYRFRILNGSNVRTYNFALTNDQPFMQIGNDSGLLPAPIVRTAGRAGSAERLDIVVDFAGMIGQTVYLRDTLSGTDLLELRVSQDFAETSSVPEVLRPLPDIGEPTVTREFQFGSVQGQWTINQQIFDHERFDAEPLRGSVEKWILTSTSNVTHVIHIHDVDQICISRNGGACLPHEPTKESWFLGPFEQVEVKLKFSDHVGPYVFHCHILEHEDDGMMSQFMVVDAPATPTPSPSPSATPPPDSDGDTVPDATDNCPSVPNLNQANYDRNFIEMSPRAYDDVTRAMSDGLGDACDTDDDNDGRLDSVEGALCPAASSPTDPLNADSDGDMAIDGAECAIGTNPGDPASRPTLQQCGDTSDADGDGIVAFREICGYGTNPNALDSDGDGCADGIEAATINGDPIVNFIDFSQIAGVFGPITLPAPLYMQNFDITRDRNITVLDLSVAAARFNQSC
jgi:FtsP/CotA-like multicopper oxidase with cupredoxin domain